MANWYKDNIVGRRTYIIAIITAVINLLIVLGYITLTPEQLVAVNGVLVALGGAALRAAK